MPILVPDVLTILSTSVGHVTATVQSDTSKSRSTVWLYAFIDRVSGQGNVIVRARLFLLYLINQLFVISIHKPTYSLYTQRSLLT